MKTIIVDDEPKSHEALMPLLNASHQLIELAGSAYSVEEGLQLIGNVQPALVFLDVEMPDGTGFDLLERSGKPNFHVIFITGHSEYAIRAIRFGALDYLLKPVAPAELAEALRRVEEKQQETVTQQQLQLLMETLDAMHQNKLPSRFGISTQEGILYQNVQDIIHLEAEKNYTIFSIAGKPKKVIASVNIGEYEEQFRPYDNFMRVHRSHIVNLSHVEKYVRSEGGYLVMRDGSEVNVSKIHRDKLLRRLEQM